MSLLHEEETHSGDDVVSETNLDLEQLQLIQLCFGEHEFGVVLENDTEDGDEDGEKKKDKEDKGEGEEIIQVEDINDIGKTMNTPQEDKEKDNSLIVAFDFDPIQFVQEKLDHAVPLRSLCRDLDTYASFLNKSILRHVNVDVHDAFVKVSGHLVGMQDELRCVQQPIVASIKKIESAMEKLSRLEAAVNSQIKDAADVEVTRLFDVNFLKLLLIFDLLYERVESLPLCLRCVENTKQQHHQIVRNINNFSLRTIAVAALSPHVSELLCDIAVTMHQLKTLHQSLPTLLSERAGEHAEASEVLHEALHLIHQIFTQVYLSLHESYIFFPDEKTREALCHVMNLYRIMREVDEFCKMYRENILRPLLDSVLSWKAATQARYSLDDTLHLLHTLQEEVEKKILCFLPLLWDSFKGIVLPIPMIVWPALCEGLIKKMVGLYDVSNADAFQKKYHTSHQLLALMVKHCHSAEELYALLQSPDVALWKHKWNTDVYGTMRINELSRKLKESITCFHEIPVEKLLEQISSLPPSQGEKNLFFHLELFTTLQESLEWLFSSSIYMYPVTMKFLRESVHFIYNVIQNIITYIKNIKQIHRMDEWLLIVMRMYADIHTFIKYIETTFCKDLEKMTGESFQPTTTTSSLSSPYIQLIVKDVCGGGILSLQHIIKEHVVDECIIGLQNIRSVKSSYSHMHKPFPTSPSWYVSSIVEPLQRASRCMHPLLTADVYREIMMELIDEVANRFRVLAKETLVTAKKTEESWEKLRRRKETSGSNINNNNISNNNNNNHGRPTQETASDRDKMTIQLYLDSKAFLHEAETSLSFSLKAAELPSVGALLKLLRRASWILGEDIPEPPDIDEAET